MDTKDEQDTPTTTPRVDDDSSDELPHTSEMSSLQVVSSIFAAGLGVQSSKNRERDFQQGRAGTFIAYGLVFTLLFIGSVYGVVQLVLSTR